MINKNDIDFKINNLDMMGKDREDQYVYRHSNRFQIILLFSFLN